MGVVAEKEANQQGHKGLIRSEERVCRGMGSDTRASTVRMNGSKVLEGVQVWRERGIIKNRGKGRRWAKERKSS